MGDQSASIGLARAADVLRAEAANGLFWGAADEEVARLHEIRGHAAALTSLVEHRPLAEIEAVFNADTGLRTPSPATEFRVRCSDGRTLVRRRRFTKATESLGDRLKSLAAVLGADIPTEVAAIGDTDQAGLPCPHTYLLVYEVDTALSTGEAERVLEPSDLDLTGPIESRPPALSAEVSSRSTLPVSRAAKQVLDEVAVLSEACLASTSNFYERERHQRIRALCADTTVTDLDYARIDCGDLAAECFATGADAAIFDDRDRLLLIRRTDTGQWAMPGGAAEVGEPVGAAAVREAFEETGLDVTLTGLLWAFDKRDARYADSRMPMIMSFSATVDDPNQPIRLAELEASDHRWISREEVDSIDFFRGHELRVPAAFAAR